MVTCSAPQMRFQTTHLYSNDPVLIHRHERRSRPEQRSDCGCQRRLVHTTFAGGANNDGTVFELVHNNDGTYTQKTLLDFNGTNGSGHLIADANGDLFGNTPQGGNGFGTVFELVHNNDGTYTLNTLLNPTSDDVPTIGGFQSSNLVADANGNLFGITLVGGADLGGTVFELVDNNDGTYTPKTVFNLVVGEQPTGGLVTDANDDLFGTTSTGGANNDGMIFELENFGGSYEFQDLFDFSGSNGKNPRGGLIIDANGDLFGTTELGGANGQGTVFELVNNKGKYTLSTLVNFTSSNGAFPFSGLSADANGDLFGTTSLSGASNATVFEITNSGFAPVPLDHWTNTRGGNWSRAGNWVTLGADQLPTTPALNEVPTAGLIADIDASGFFGLTTGTSYSIDITTTASPRLSDIRE